MRQLIVKPLGLVTRPNIYGVYPEGALSLAQNLVMRAPGILEAAPATVLGLSFPTAAGVQVNHMQPLDGGVMMAWTSDGAVRRDATVLSYQSGIGSASYSLTGRLGSIRMRGRTLFNSTDRGILVVDDSSPTVIRRAGLPVPVPIGQSLASLSANNVSLISGDTVGYTYLFRREDSDGYTLLSPPCPILIVRNQSAAPLVLRPELFPFCGTLVVNELRVGDIVELYRTNITPDGTATTDPGTSCQMIYEHALTSADLATGFLDMFDDTRRGPLGQTDGKALYTNPGQGGSTQRNRQPPIAQCLAVFKTYAFYGCITERPQMIFEIPGYVASTSLTGWDTTAFRRSGIGERQITGTVTNGSPTITGISAAHMVGVDFGQAFGTGIGGATFPPNTTVQSFNTGAGTITMSANATAGGTGVYLYDRIEINGAMAQLFHDPYTVISQTQGVEWTTTENVPTNAFDPATVDGIRKITFIAEPRYFDTATPFTWRATNGQNYSPPLPGLNQTALSIPYTTRKNVLVWSKENQPEHVPAPNETLVGAGEIIALEPTRDALWIFCTDGLYRLSGAGGIWRVDPVDTTLVLSSPRASCVLRDVVYCYTNQGFGRVTDAGFEALGDALVGDLLPGAEYTETASIILERNEAEDEIVIRIDATQVYVYSVRENAFTTLLEPDVTCMAYVRYPVSGAACLAFGRSPSGQQPRYELWNAPSSKLAAQAQFQPLFGKDPFATKHWVDASFIFDAQSVGALVTPYWNGVASPASALVGNSVFVKEARRSFGIPRSAPAVGNTLTVGYAIPAHATRPGKLYAIALRYRQFGEESLKRLANAG